MKRNNNEQEPGMLALADGRVFSGMLTGAIGEVSVGEVVFNTAMYGYQEICTDPSYAGQIITFTYPHIGNVGCNDDDIESDTFFAAGIILRNLSRRVSNFRSKESLSEYLKKNNKQALFGIDTRELVTHIRTHGSQMGAMGVGVDREMLIESARAQGSMLGKNYVTEVSCKAPYSWNGSIWELSTNSYGNISEQRLSLRPHVVALDCGIKHNILRLLTHNGFRVTVAPAGISFKDLVALNPDGIFLSNGPGDPATLGNIVSVVKSCIGKFPIFGICLGHQILGQALGGKTFKLKFGHRGGNHPVKDLTTGKVEITVQNHGFAVDQKTLPSDVEVTHINLNDETVEGLQVHSKKVFSVQYHPESSPGPTDSQYLFKRFYDLVVN